LTVSKNHLLREMRAVAAMVDKVARDMSDVLTEAHLINIEAQEGGSRIDAMRDRSAH